MKKTITIFVSGSKSLKQHRLRLKALVNNLNGENRLNGDPVTLNMFSYINLGDHQAEYDDFIQKRTDIILFLIEDRFGDKTQEELKLATEAYRKKGSPKIVFFVRDSEGCAPDQDLIQKLIRETPDSEVFSYSDLDDLEARVKEYLEKEVHSIREGSALSSGKGVKKLKAWAWAATAAVLALLLTGFLRDRNQRKDVTLLFIGGGSAVSCLEEKYPEVGNVYDYSNSICIAVPTSTAWPIITSEVIQHHGVKGAKNSRLFYPVCLSAMEATEDKFLKMSNKAQFVSKGSVLALHLGDDYLMTYVKNTLRHPIIDGKDSIGIRDLAAFLQEMARKDCRIFTTEEGSGTLTYYQKSLAPFDVTITKAALGEQVDKFTDLTPKSKIRKDETPYLMLGSKYYVAKEVYDEGDCRGICILDEDGNAITKSIYLYFAGYYADGGASFWIPDAMVNLLNKIDPRFGTLIRRNKLPRDSERVIVPLNDYLSAQ